jgi:hypothetical protein
MEAEVADLVRGQVAAATLIERLRAAQGRTLVVHTGSEVWRGRLASVGPDWLMLADAWPGGLEALLPTSGVDAVVGLSTARTPQQAVHAIDQRLDLRLVLRALARERLPVHLVTASGRWAGLLSRVATDHVDLDATADARWSTSTAATSRRTVALGAVLAIGPAPLS